MLTVKKYCAENNVDPSRVLDMVLGLSDGILPKARGFTGYIAEIKDDCLEFTNDKFGVFHKQIPFSDFSEAVFGIGSGQLWLQCVVADNPFVFCLRRKHWKSETAKLLLSKIGEHTEILGQKEYDHYTGKLFLFYAIKNA